MNLRRSLESNELIPVAGTRCLCQFKSQPAVVRMSVIWDRPGDPGDDDSVHSRLLADRIDKPIDALILLIPFINVRGVIHEDESILSLAAEYAGRNATAD